MYAIMQTSAPTVRKAEKITIVRRNIDCSFAVLFMAHSFSDLLFMTEKVRLIIRMKINRITAVAISASR